MSSYIRNTEANKAVRAAVLQEYIDSCASNKVDTNNQAIRFSRAGQPVTIDEAMFVKVIAQATDTSVHYVITNGYHKFSHLHGATYMVRPDWKLLIRVCQSFSTWTTWHDIALPMSDIATRFESVYMCIRNIPSVLRRQIAEQIVSDPSYENWSEHTVYGKVKMMPHAETHLVKFIDAGGKSMDIQRFCRFIRGLRRRRSYLAGHKRRESENLTLADRLNRIRWSIAECPPNRHATHLSDTERVIAQRMYPEGKLLGIEIEFGCHKDTELMEADSCDYPAIPGITWKTDSSVGSYENDGMCVGHRQEVNMLINPDREQDWDKVKQTLAWLRKNGGTVNYTCGLHVHIDTRDLQGRTYTNRARHLRSMFKSWAKYLVNKRRATNYFCNINGTDRYSAVNTYCRSEHNTVEIRIGHSTLNLHKVRLWCEFVRWCKTAKKSEILTFEGFMSSSCDPVVKAYLLSRIVRFADTWGEELPNRLKTQLSASSDDICV